MAGRAELRRIVVQVMNAPHVLQYHYAGERLVVLRVLHAASIAGDDS